MLRVQFIRLSSISLSLSLLSLSRAALCELLAIRLLRAWSERTLELAHVLLTPWDLYQGASDVVRQRLEDEGEEGVERVGNALEVGAGLWGDAADGARSDLSVGVLSYPRWRSSARASALSNRQVVKRYGWSSINHGPPRYADEVGPCAPAC